MCQKSRVRMVLGIKFVDKDRWSVSLKDVSEAHCLSVGEMGLAVMRPNVESFVGEITDVFETYPGRSLNAEDISRRGFLDREDDGEFITTKLCNIKRVFLASGTRNGCN